MLVVDSASARHRTVEAHGVGGRVVGHAPQSVAAGKVGAQVFPVAQVGAELHDVLEAGDASEADDVRAGAGGRDVEHGVGAGGGGDLDFNRAAGGADRVAGAILRAHVAHGVVEAV